MESVCHALHIEKVLSEVFRVLKSEGTFILFDGFRNAGFENFNDSLKTAAILVEKSMAVQSFREIDEWLRTARITGFEALEKLDISNAIMPNLLKLHKLSLRYFKHPKLAKLVLCLLPSIMVKNSIAGMLMPYTISETVHGYYKIILKKP